MESKKVGRKKLKPLDEKESKKYRAYIPVFREKRKIRGQLLRDARKKGLNPISQKRLAEIARLMGAEKSLHQRSVARIEAGEKDMTVGELDLFCRILNKDPSYFLDLPLTEAEEKLYAERGMKRGPTGLIVICNEKKLPLISREIEKMLEDMED